VTFNPAVAGAVTGQLTFTSNSTQGATTAVALNGTGVHHVDLAWGAPASSPVAVSGYNVYRSTGTSGFTFLTSLASTQVTYVDLTVQSGTAYGYYVTSTSGSGSESSASNHVTVTVP
jgi:fibronectin type 3 domain-containing protein